LDGGEGDALLAQSPQPGEHVGLPPGAERLLPCLIVARGGEVAEPAAVRGMAGQEVHQLGEGQGVAAVEGDRERGPQDPPLPASAARRSGPAREAGTGTPSPEAGTPRAVSASTTCAAWAFERTSTATSWGPTPSS